MTNFLPAGIITDTLNELCQKISELRVCITDPEDEKVVQGLNEIEEMILDLLVFLQNLSCQPLIYTGKGTTEEVIKRLNWALTFMEDVDILDVINAYMKNQKHDAR